MKFSRSVAISILAGGAVTAFTCAPSSRRVSSSISMADSPFFSSDIETSIDRQMSAQPGKADSDFARKFGHLSGLKLRTVGEAFEEFTNILGTPVNALYKGIATDLVGSLHLVVVNARFQKDAVFSLGLVTALDLVLKNYPELETGKKIKAAVITSVGLNEDEIDADAASLEAWAQGKSKDEITAAMKGEGDSLLAQVAKAAKDDQWWMYSRFFGIGLVRLMDIVGVDMDESVAYDVMEEWVGKSMEKPHYTACSDSDMYFKQKGKLDMMETMMKEIEIREKKRMADRLEAKADMALIQAEKDAKMKDVIAEEASEKEEAAKEAKEETLA